MQTKGALPCSGMLGGCAEWAFLVHVRKRINLQKKKPQTHSSQPLPAAVQLRTGRFHRSQDASPYPSGAQQKTPKQPKPRDLLK